MSALSAFTENTEDDKQDLTQCDVRKGEVTTGGRQSESAEPQQVIKADVLTNELMDSLFSGCSLSNMKLCCFSQKPEYLSDCEVVSGLHQKEPSVVVVADHMYQVLGLCL